MVKIMTAAEAIHSIIKDGDTVAFTGFVGSMHAEHISRVMQDEYLATGSPKNLTIMYSAGIGDGKSVGLNHLGEEGLISKVVAGHWGLVPRLQKLALEEKIYAYNFPQGVLSQLYRCIAAGRPGLVSQVGLKTFVDPRLEGGKLNKLTKEKGEDFVELVNIGGREMLFYKAMKIDVAVIRASFVDTNGNCSMEHEGMPIDALALAQAARNSGGKVIVQANKVVEYGSLDYRFVKVPGILVDAVVVAPDEEHMQTNGTFYNPAFSGEIRVPLESVPPLPMNERKVIARRAAMELIPSAVVNLGVGMPEGVATVAAEEGLEGLVLTTESGTIGGVPGGGADFGVTWNADCVVNMDAQFDFYDGGGVDVCYLGLAEADENGNLNVSKFGPKIAGAGGFINISQNSKACIYVGTFTAGGLKVEAKDGKLTILQEGKSKKFVKTVEQITFAADYAREVGQKVMYITERAVFKLTKEGMELIEIAPGIDLQKDVLDQMEFTPIMKDVKIMDERIFREEKMGLKS